MKNIKIVKLSHFFYNVITTGVLLYFIFAEQWDYFLILSVFLIVITLLEIVSYLRINDIAQNTKEKPINFTMNVTSAKEVDIHEISKQIEEHFSKELNRYSNNI